MHSVFPSGTVGRWLGAGMANGHRESVVHYNFCAVALAALVACSTAASSNPEFSPAPAQRDDSGTVKVDPASRSYIVAKPIEPTPNVAVIRAPARIAFRDGAVSQISAPITGRVTAVHVKSGDRVKVGDPLVTIVSPEAASARASVNAAQAELEAAETEVKRQDRMKESGVGVETEHVVANTRLRQARAELERARTTGALLGPGAGSTVVLRAPIEGTVIVRRATVGAVAQPSGDALIELGNPSALWVVAEVFERDLAQVGEGADVDVELGTGDAVLHGKVVSIGSALTGNLRTAPVYIALDEADKTVRAGMYARASIKAPEAKGLTLPAKAVLIKDGKTSIVYVKTGDAEYKPRTVRVGPSVDGKVQVLSGLQAGDPVVVEGALLLDQNAEQLL
jgi:membrane fusion protein, heavy metal efflux system